jgi:hypothetical protein
VRHAASLWHLYDVVAEVHAQCAALSPVSTHCESLNCSPGHKPRSGWLLLASRSCRSFMDAAAAPPMPQPCNASNCVLAPAPVAHISTNMNAMTTKRAHACQLALPT